VRANEFFTHIQEKNDVGEKYRSRKFILGVQNGLVKKMGAFASLFKPSYRSSQERKERVMQNISVENARWIGSLLNDLSDEQLRDAFRAANYDKQTMDGLCGPLRPRRFLYLMALFTAESQRNAEERSEVLEPPRYLEHSSAERFP